MSDQQTSTTDLERAADDVRHADAELRRAGQAVQDARESLRKLEETASRCHDALWKARARLLALVSTPLAEAEAWQYGGGDMTGPSETMRPSAEVSTKRPVPPENIKLREGQRPTR